MTYLVLVGGFIYLLMGGDLLVRGSVSLARRLQVPPVVVAATVVGFGTSVPELVVSLQATFTGYPNLILGNVVGSNIANVLLVGGVAATIHPLVREDSAVRRNVIIMMASLVVFVAFAARGELGSLSGLVLLSAFVIVMVSTAGSSIRARQGRDMSTPLDWVIGLPSRLPMIGLFIVAGTIMLPLGAQLLVSSAVDIANSFQVPETVIGLTVLAVGTSLPELTTTVLAARQRRADVAIGAIVGSNTFNILAIMGVTATLSPIPVAVSSRMMRLDVPVMMLTSAALATVAWRARPIGRGAGVLMLLAYGVYLGTLYLLV